MTRSTNRRHASPRCSPSAGGWSSPAPGPGIMQAAMEGAGREHSIGVSIRLPFEQGANPVIAGDEKYVSMKYFFTRKLMLVKESRAFVCLPGGFGTLDETFELLTLTQTGKGLPVPIVFLDTPGDPYWEAIDDMIRRQLVERGLVAESDRSLYLVTDSCEAAVGRDRPVLRQLPLDPLRRRLPDPAPAARADAGAARRAQRAVRPPRRARRDRGHGRARHRAPPRRPRRAPPHPLRLRQAPLRRPPRPDRPRQLVRPRDIRGFERTGGFAAPRRVRKPSDGSSLELTQQAGGLLDRPPGLGQRAVGRRALRSLRRRPPAGAGRRTARRARPRSPPAARRGPRSASCLDRLGDEVDRVPDVETGRGEVEHTARGWRSPRPSPRIARRPARSRRPCGRGSRGRAPVRARRRRRRRRSTAPRRRARRRRRRGRRQYAPRRAPAARGGGDTDRGRSLDRVERTVGRQPVVVLGEPFVDVADPGRERMPLGAVEEVAVVLHQRHRSRRS